MQVKPKLSIVVVTHEMERELPRTLRSISTEVQNNIALEDYEIIVVDNSLVGSASLNDVKWNANVTLFRPSSVQSSPCRAINEAVLTTRGSVLGIMIDGARMASPGLLSAALAATKLSDRSVVGTLAYHLGSKVQNESIHEGYCQAAEDELLATVDWEEDGYELFRISVLAVSSKLGWFKVPAETNALFMHRNHWFEIGGFDERFISPGGGLANLDLWRRLCEDKTNDIVMLFGEATFHQFHGGVATNTKDVRGVGVPFLEEYFQITGRKYEAPQLTPNLYGKYHPLMSKSLASSIFDGH